MRTINQISSNTDELSDDKPMNEIPNADPSNRSIFFRNSSKSDPDNEADSTRAMLYVTSSGYFFH